MTRRARMLLSVLLLVAARDARAQDAGGEEAAVPEAAGGGIGSAIVFGGEAGTFSEANWVFGAESRRPPASARLYLRPSLSLYEKWTVTGNFIVSTEDRTFQGDIRQSLNQYSISPDWGWGSATLGDFSDSYSPLTFSGVQVRGATVELRRNTLQFALLGGRSQQAAEGGAIRGRYARTIGGGRLAIGDPDKASLALVVLSARDDVGSLDEPTDTLFLEPTPDTTFVEDTLQIGVENQFAVTPQANLVVGVAGTLALFGDLLMLKAEIAGSGHTRDLRSDVIENEEILDRIPGIARALFTPRTSSTADYAHTLEARLRPFSSLTTTLSYRYLGPGYVSLGAASLHSDLQEIQLRTSLRRRRFQVNLDLARQHDNLAEQKLFTTIRDRAALSAAVRVTSWLTTTLRGHRATLGNEATEPERWIDYTSWQAGLRNTVTLSRGGTFRSASLDYNHRTTGDENPLRTSTASESHSVTANLQISPSRVLSVTPTLGFVRSQFADAGWTTRSTYGVGSQLTVLDGRWATSLDVGRSQFQQTAALQSNLTSRFQVTARDAVIFGFRAADYDNVLDPELAFNELSASLRWAHRF